MTSLPCEPSSHLWDLNTNCWLQSHSVQLLLSPPSATSVTTGPSALRTVQLPINELTCRLSFVGLTYPICKYTKSHLTVQLFIFISFPRERKEKHYHAPNQPAAPRCLSMLNLYLLTWQRRERDLERDKAWRRERPLLLNAPSTQDKTWMTTQ